MLKTLLSRSRRSRIFALVLGGAVLAAAGAIARAAAGPTTPTGNPKSKLAIGTITIDDMPAFEIKDFSFGVENPTTIGSATGGAGAGKIKFNEFTIKKTSDASSPTFFKNCVAGSHYKTVTITMRKAGGDPSTAGKAFLKFQFETVFTTKIDWSGPGDEGPEESITFVYGRITVSASGSDGTSSSGPIDTR
jgi:type VI secretion system secreted protein Hcp